MKQLIIEIEPEIAEALERIAPARSRRRSEFIRRAIRKALWELEEQATAEAYRRAPDVEVAPVAAETWEAREPAPTRRAPARRANRARGKR
jgi:predicted transcriptional regulator